MKKAIYGDEARSKLIEAAEALCNPVKVTLGPKGKNVIINPIDGMAHSTKDGVTVAGEIESADPFINAGIKIFRQAASKTVADAGDGTTTATILAHSLINEINNELMEGKDIASIKLGLTEQLKICVKAIRQFAHPLVVNNVLDLEKLKQIATISANNDEMVGELFSDAYSVIGPAGTILLEESKKSETYIEAVPGMRQERGYVSQYFVNKEKMRCEYDEPVYFVTDKKLTQSTDFIKIAAHCHSQNKPLIIICEDIDGEALSSLNINRLKNNLQVCAITIPNWIRQGRDIIEDIAVYTGATFCSEKNAFSIDNLQEENIDQILGSSEKFSAGIKESIIIGGKGTEIKERVANIDAQIVPEIASFEQEQLRARSSRLNGGVAILYAGGQTEVERKETLDRCEDAVLAVRSALEEGYLPGGGKIYLLCRLLMPNSILSRSLKVITEQICLNADKVPDKIISKIESANDSNFGYNAKTDTLEDLCKAGVVDSAKVIRVALENAVSISLAFLNTDCLIADFKD